MGQIAERVDTTGPAFAESNSATGAAHTRGAFQTSSAGIGALATIESIGLQINARSSTFGLPRTANELFHRRSGRAATSPGNECQA